MRVQVILIRLIATWLVLAMTGCAERDELLYYLSGAWKMIGSDSSHCIIFHDDYRLELFSERSIVRPVSSEMLAKNALADDVKSVFENVTKISYAYGYWDALRGLRYVRYVAPVRGADGAEVPPDERGLVKKFYRVVEHQKNQFMQVELHTSNLGGAPTSRYKSVENCDDFRSQVDMDLDNKPQWDDWGSIYKDKTSHVEPTI